MRVFVAGHRGMVGAAVVRQLADRDVELVTAEREDLDLLQQAKVYEFLGDHRVDRVVLAAAKVGGILANETMPAEFIFENLTIQNHVVDGAYRAGVRSLMFLGSSCVYPKFAAQPMAEAELLTGALEPTNEPYAIAKIAGIKLCESYNRQYGLDYRCVMPTNLYGPHDNFHPEHSHVIPALMRRFHEAKTARAAEVAVWGTGQVRREFMHVDDMAAATVHLMDVPAERYWAVAAPRLSHVNVGTGQDVTIGELAETMAAVVGFAGAIAYDAGKPEGTPRKLLDTSRLRALGWRPAIGLREGLSDTYRWFRDHVVARPQ